MERLTARQAIKHADGTSHIVTYCHGHRYGPAAFPGKYGTSNPQEYENYCEMVDRLAAYEDIGTVEDFQRLKRDDYLNDHLDMLLREYAYSNESMTHDALELKDCLLKAIERTGKGGHCK